MKMDENVIIKLSPWTYVMDLFSRTRDNKLLITHYPTNGEDPYSLSYTMDWSKKDAEEVIFKFQYLVAMLRKLAQLSRDMENDEAVRAGLSEAELSVWDTFISPFEPFETDLSVIADLYLRGEFDELSDEENSLLALHDEWFEDQYLKRLPYCRLSPKHFINRARRYYHLVQLNAPEIIINEEVRCLAEEMVLYYCSAAK